MSSASPSELNVTRGIEAEKQSGKRFGLYFTELIRTATSGTARHKLRIDDASMHGRCCELSQPLRVVLLTIRSPIRMAHYLGLCLISLHSFKLTPGYHLPQLSQLMRIKTRMVPSIYCCAGEVGRVNFVCLSSAKMSLVQPRTR